MDKVLRVDGIGGQGSGGTVLGARFWGQSIKGGRYWRHIALGAWYWWFNLHLTVTVIVWMGWN